MAALVTIPWYRGEDWSRWKMLLSDGHRLPPAYGSWCNRIEEVRRRLEHDGYRVDRIFLDIQIFTRWCNDRDIEPSADAGWQFAAEASLPRH